MRTFKKKVKIKGNIFNILKVNLLDDIGQNITVWISFIFNTKLWQNNFIFDFNIVRPDAGGLAVKGVDLRPSLPGIAGSNSAEWTDVCLLWILCVSDRSLCDGPIPRPEEYYRVWCVYLYVTSKPQQWGGLGRSTAVAPQQKMSKYLECFPVNFVRQ